MENILNIIIETDEKAREAAKTAEEERTLQKHKILKEKEKIYNDYISLAKTRVNKDIDSTKEKQKKKLSFSLEQNDKILSQMEKTFSENREKWADEIFSETIKV